MASSRPYNHLAAKAQKFQRIAKKVDYLKRLEKPRSSLDERWVKINSIWNRYHGSLQGENPESVDLCQEEPVLEDLSCLTDIFKELKIKEGMVLDGFYSGIPDFGYDMKLHVRKKENAQLFTPPDWHDNVYHLDQNIQKERIQLLQSFDHNMYIREGVHAEEEKYLHRELWEQMTVPFNETGIWEATLLYIAPYILPRFWHANYDAFEIICCDSNISRHKPDSIYIEDQEMINEHRNSSIEEVEQDLKIPLHNRVIPDMFICDDLAMVRLAIWGWDGLESLSLSVQKDGDTVQFLGPFRHSLEYVRNDIIY